MGDSEEEKREQRENQGNGPHGFGGLYIPIELISDERLNWTDRPLFAVIKLFDMKNHCFASNQYLARILNLSEITISNSINRLIEFGYVEKVSFDGRRRVIKINDSYLNSRKESVDDYYTNLKSDLKNFKGRLKADFKADLKLPLSRIEDIEPIEDIENKSVNTKTVFTDYVTTGQENFNNKNGFNIPITPIFRKNKSPIIIEPKYKLQYRREVMDIILYWNNSPGLPHIQLPPIVNGIYATPTKTFTSVVSIISKVLDGNYFTAFGLGAEESRPYSKEEIISVIDKYKLAATNPSYYPFEKRFFRSIGLSSFFYNSFSLKEQSQFLRYLKEEPKLILSTIKEEPEKNKNLTIWLKEAYNKKVNLTDRKFSKLEEMKFVKGANLLHDTIEIIQKKLNMMTRPIEWAYYTIDALVDYWPNDDILPGHVCSEYTYNTILPKFLKKKGRID